MARVISIRLFLKISIFFIGSYIIYFLPYFKEVEYLELLNILFLNYKEFSDYGLSKINIMYSVLFIILFYILYHGQLSGIQENSSFMSIVLYKMGKKTASLWIIKETLYSTIQLYIVVVSIILLIHVSSSSLSLKFLQESSILLLWMYLSKYFMFLFGMVASVRLASIIRSLPVNIVAPYILFFSLFIIDFSLETSFITKSSSLLGEFTFF